MFYSFFWYQSPNNTPAFLCGWKFELHNHMSFFYLIFVSSLGAYRSSEYLFHNVLVDNFTY